MCIHYFKSDLIDNMDHMRILGIESLTKHSSLNRWKVMPKSGKTRLSEKGWYNKHTELQFQLI